MSAEMGVVCLLVTREWGVSAGMGVGSGTGLGIGTSAGTVYWLGNSIGNGASAWKFGEEFVSR